MDMEIGREWVAALRSGEFEQGQFALHTIDADGSHAYCCLGVLCEIAVKHGVVSREEQTGRVGYGVEMDFSYPPAAVWKWAGLDGSRGAIPYAGRLRALSELNDMRGLSFDEIADVIEIQLLGGGS